MKLIEGINALSAQHKPSSVTIGNFDGVHLGHQMVIKTLIQEAQVRKVASTVITFEPLAKEFFAPDSSLRLQTVENRLEELQKLGVDQTLLIKFDQGFASLSPQTFIQQVLVDGLGVNYLSVGDDFRFGNKRSGDFELLKRQGEQRGFDVTSHNTLSLNESRISSGRLRDAVKAGDFTTAKQLLGRLYTINGTVSHGQKRGREIGFPTANVLLDANNFAVQGVYAVTAQLCDGLRFDGVANVGHRPTVNGKENRLEVHLFNFDQDIYGQELSVEFVEKIRDEKKFADFGALQIQIALDAQSAKDVLSGIS